MRTVSILGATAAVLATLVFSTPAAAETLVVVEARGIGWARPGSTMDSRRSLTLRQGQHLELVTGSGSSITLNGPFEGTPDSAGSSGGFFSSLSTLLSSRSARTSEVGTVRGQKEHELPGPWLVDATRAGNACLQDSAVPVFWRPDATKQATIVVMPEDRTWKAVEVWPAGLDRLTVDTQVPMRSGALYFVVLNGTEVAINLRPVPRTLSTDAMRAAWMAEKGCEAQARALSRTLQ